MSAVLTTMIYQVGDVTSAKKLFTTLLGAEPYADAPYYVGWRVGELEVGLTPKQQELNGLIGYYDVEDIVAALQSLVDAGATTLQEPRNVGGGLQVASVAVGDGNIIGLRQNP